MFVPIRQVRRTQPLGDFRLLPEYQGVLTYLPGKALAVGGGSPSYSVNKLGNTLQGNGSSWLVLPSTITLPNDRTIVVAHGGVSSNASMVMGNTGGTGNFLWLNNGSGAVRCRGNGNDIDITADMTKPCVLVLRYAYTKSGGPAELFVDGRLVGSGSNGYQTPMTINAIGNGYNSASYALNGGLNLIHILPRVVSDFEARQISANPWMMFEP